MSKIVLSGNFDFLNFGDILQVVGSNGGTGVLSVISKYISEPGMVYFSKGNIIHCTADTEKGLDAVYSLFGWTEADFQFSEENVQVEQTIQTNRMEIILDGLRMVDDGQTKKLGPVDYEKPKESGQSAVPIIKGPLVDYMYVAAEEEFYKGRKIVEENKHGSWIWIILEGIVDIIKESPKGPVNIIRLGAGSFIGGVTCFMFRENVRTATAQAGTDVQLGVLDSQRLADEFGNQRREFRDLIISLEKRRELVTENALNAYIGQNRIRQCIQNKKPLKSPGGDSRIFRIKKGEVCIVRKIREGLLLPLALLGEGHFIGTCPFMKMGQEPDNAIIFASEDLQVEPYKTEPLVKAYDRLSATLRNLIESISTNIMITTRMASEYIAAHEKKK